MEDTFWANNLQILFSSKKLNKFIPKKGMTENQIYNAIVRFSIYLSIVLVILNNNLNYLGVAIIGLIGTYVYKYYLNVEENFVETDESKSSDKLKDLDFKFVNHNCKTPTDDNPFMNRMLTDDLGTLKPACETNPVVKEQIDTIFNNNMEAQMENIYNPDFNQRAFYTMPNTEAANDQKSFRDWLYKSSEQCKLEQDLEITDSVRGCNGISGFESACTQGFSNYSLS